MNKRFRGSITIEMSYVFPIILIVILIMGILSLYLSDIVSMRAYLQTYICVEVKSDKTEETMENELKNNLKDYTYITKVTDIHVIKEKDILKVKVNLSSKIMDIILNDSMEVKGYIENNREYLVKTKVFIDSIKGMGGINIWKWFIRKI